jgi:hypothetical protein
MAREGGCEWYQSIGLKFLYISADSKKIFKGPRPFKKQKTNLSGLTLFMGRYWIMWRPGLKTE